MIPAFGGFDPVNLPGRSTGAPPPGRAVVRTAKSTPTPARLPCESVEFKVY